MLRLGGTREGSWFRNFSLEHEWGGHGPFSVEPVRLWSSTVLSKHVLTELCTYKDPEMQMGGRSCSCDRYEESIDGAQGRGRFSWLVLAALEIVPTLVSK